MKLFIMIGGLSETLSNTQRALVALIAVFTFGITVGASTMLFYGLPAKVDANTEAIGTLIEAQRVLTIQVCELAQPDDATLREVRAQCSLSRPTSSEGGG